MTNAVMQLIAGNPRQHLDSELLATISRAFAMPLPDVFALIQKSCAEPVKDGSCHTFYPLALLLHAEYLEIEPVKCIPTVIPLEEEGRWGKNPLESAKKLKMAADSMGGAGFRDFSVFITAKGRFKLEELAREELNTRRLWLGWVVSLTIATLVAVLAACLRR